MSNLLQLQKGYKQYGPKEIFIGASFAINQSEHVAVIGPNGAGKTTLFRILTGQESLDEGQITMAQGLRLGYLAQHDQWAEGETVEDYLSEGCIKPIWELKALGRGLGLSQDMYSQPIRSLSGGFRMRCKLLHLLGEEPDLLLLDEPTNYLDLETLMVLERFLQEYPKAFMLISHDREFLRKTTDHVLEVEQGDITKFNGTLDDYFEQKEMLRDQLAARALSVEQRRKEILDFVRRFGAKATKAKQAQSKLKSLNKLEKIDIKALPVTANINIPEPIRTGKQIMDLSEVDLGYGPVNVLTNVNLQIWRGDHVAIVGVNGAGKTTLLKAMAEHLEPQKGEVKHGHNVSVGYYAQHVTEALNPGHTVLEAMAAKAHPDIVPQQVQDLAGALLFSTNEVRKKVKVLSGGEKSRVALGQILLQKSPCLILDEPTNHLDFQTVEALTQALRKFKGSLVVVSHDRSFIQRVGRKIIEVDQGRVELYPGSYDEYVWSVQKGVLSEREQQETSSEGPPKNQKNSALKSQKRDVRQKVKHLEAEIRKLDKRMKSRHEQMEELNQKLTECPGHSEFNNWLKHLNELQIEVNTLEERWLDMEQEKDSLQEQD